MSAPNYSRYEEFVDKAKDELRIGGDPAKAQAWATLALAQSNIALNEQRYREARGDYYDVAGMPGSKGKR